MSQSMKFALELALRGAGNVSPNPMVGAVIVHNGQVIGRGWHERYGQAHAEVNAINSVENQELLREATMYVTLEPCSHWGKTPPCCDLIIAKSIPHVVVGCIDSYHKVSGEGIRRMLDAGVKVEVGDMERECVELNRRFFTVQTLERPYIILKWAQTSDHVLDMKRSINTPPAWLTGTQGKRLVHQWRAHEDAIMVGRHTVEMDNPSLTVREVQGRNPLRVTMDRDLKLDTTHSIFDNNAPTVLITSCENRDAAVLKFANNDSVKVVAINYDEAVLSQILTILNGERVQSLFVEGGRELLQSFIDAGLWDEARVFTSDICSDELYPLLVERERIDAPSLPDKMLMSRERCGSSELIIYRKDNSTPNLSK